MSRKIGLYIHIPFCKTKCNYCDFNSRAGVEALIEPYFTALEKELRNYSQRLDNYSIGTVFIGGGTPSLVDTKHIYQLLNSIFSSFHIGTGAEISIESNPGTLTYEKLLSYRVCGINRLSMGLQACQDPLLKKLGRTHTLKDFTANVESAVKAGFKNINGDLIFGIPGQNINDWNETLKTVISLGLQHISCYSLKIEEDTPLFCMVESGSLEPVEDELDRRMYRNAVDELNKHGYKHYEISNFAIPGYECRHNMVYWKADEYLGLGAGAHSYMSGKRYSNVCDIEDYINKLMDNENHTEGIQEIDKEESMSEFMILGLRLVDGISVAEFRERYGEDVCSVFGKQIERLTRRQLLESENGRLKLSPYGLDVANSVFEEFI